MIMKFELPDEEEYDFNVGDELSDVTLVVEDHELLVHKAILGKQFKLIEMISKCICQIN